MFAPRLLAGCRARTRCSEGCVSARSFCLLRAREGGDQLAQQRGAHAVFGGGAVVAVVVGALADEDVVGRGDLDAGGTFRCSGGEAERSGKEVVIGPV